MSSPAERVETKYIRTYYDISPDEAAVSGLPAYRGRGGWKSWTVGALGNHLWSISGNDKYGDLSATFLQPFVSYTTTSAWSFTVNSESSYDWKAEEWLVPINFAVAKVTHLGKQPVSFQVAARYWADAPENGPEGWGPARRGDAAVPRMTPCHPARHTPCRGGPCFAMDQGYREGARSAAMTERSHGP